METLQAKKLSANSKLDLLPPYLFVELDRKKEEAIRRGVDIINLGIGDPDQPTPALTIRSAAKALKDPTHHRYPLGKGKLAFRKSVAYWFKNRFSVELDPEREVLALLGTKEGIGHLPLALASPGELVLIPDPGYPPYRSGAILAGARVHTLSLLEDKGFLPDLDSIPEKIRREARLLFLNYPNNPTGACADLAFFEKAVDWAKRHGVWLAHDAAYSETYLSDSARPPSVLQVPGAKEVALEFHSLSKTYNMTGWRVGWACGCPKALEALAQVKDNFDSGVFGAIQEAAAYTLAHGDRASQKMRQTYRARRDLFVPGLRRLGWDVFQSSATFYIWARAPKGYASQRCCEKILEEAGIVCTPGNGFGSHGEGYIRFALTVAEKRLHQALQRLSKIKW